MALQELTNAIITGLGIALGVNLYLWLRETLKKTRFKIKIRGDKQSEKNTEPNSTSTEKPNNSTRIRAEKPADNETNKTSEESVEKPRVEVYYGIDEGSTNRGLEALRRERKGDQEPRSEEEEI